MNHGSQARSDAVLFVGAGASVPAGCPSLEGLFTAVAEFALAGHRDGATSAQTRLAEYLHLSHGFDKQRLASVVGKPDRLAQLTDVLTTLDVAIADSGSFGKLPNGGFTGKHRQFSGGRLQRVRKSIVTALAMEIDVRRSGRAAVSAVQEMERRKTGLQSIQKMAERFCNGTIITTNWDTFLDRALWRTEELQPSERGSWVPSRRVDYTPVAQEIVDYYGERINATIAKLPGTRLLKLHGSMNWLACPRCKRLIVNPVIDLLAEPEAGNTGKKWIDQTCWCESEAEALLVTPSYAKNYSNVHLQAIWRDALQALAESSRWIFVGFSIPSDDAWVRALLTRALAWKRAAQKPMQEVVVVDYSEDPEDAEKSAAAGVEGSSKTAKFCQAVERYRSVLAEFGAGSRLVPWARGLDAWVAAGMKP